MTPIILLHRSSCNLPLRTHSKLWHHELENAPREKGEQTAREQSKQGSELHEGNFYLPFNTSGFGCLLPQSRKNKLKNNQQQQQEKFHYIYSLGLRWEVITVYPLFVYLPLSRKFGTSSPPSSFRCPNWHQEWSKVQIFRYTWGHVCRLLINQERNTRVHKVRWHYSPKYLTVSSSWTISVYTRSWVSIF